MDSRISVQRERIERVREALARQGAHALLVPSADPHLSEYLPERWQGRQWLSGFTGSMGTLVVTLERAALFADSRYWVQAEAELAGSGIELVKIPTGTATHHIDWLVARSLAQGGRRLRSTARCWAWPRRSSCGRALDKAGIVLRTDARPAGRRLARAPRPARAQPVYEHQAPQAPLDTRAPSWRGCARRWRGTAPRITSSPPSTTSPGSPTCAAATSTTTRCSWRTC